MRKTVLEMKLRWYHRYIEPIIDPDALDLILMSEFDENGRLVLPYGAQNSELYERYWKRLFKKLGSESKQRTL